MARILAASVAFWALLGTVAAAQLDMDHTGTLSNVRVSKLNLAFGASADLTFDLEYLVRISALMGAPIVNCGLRVRSLSGSVSVMLLDERRQIPITSENSDDVAVLYLGFVLHRFNIGLSHGWIRTLTVNCQPGVIAREDSQPFNVASNPGLDRFFCANAEVPAVDIRNELPDMMGPDWCSDHGGTFVSADVARELFRDGAMDDIGGWGGFSPRVTALGIGIAELVGNERQRLTELSREQDQADREADATARPDPSTTIARLAAERARVAQDEAANSEQPDEATTTPDPVSIIARMARARARAADLNTQEPVIEDIVAMISPALSAMTAPAVTFREEGPFEVVRESGRLPEIMERESGRRIGRLPLHHVLVQGRYLVRTARYDCEAGQIRIPGVDPESGQERTAFQYSCRQGFADFFLHFETDEDRDNDRATHFTLNIADGARQTFNPEPPPPCTGLRWLETARTEARSFRLDFNMDIEIDFGVIQLSEGHHAGSVLCLQRI
ncbi:hypothetical protein PUT78_21495 [Roseinatronobacter sp. HJB301]|uniref:Uncharacterized protein n=2 Tax=Roseinatronobacter alkalisoli TaxID=3028235 RepID=A0ABT5TI85_9RHOB|nr:hypothetical protein [Roseinatronobacter sp. HJB301]